MTKQQSDQPTKTIRLVPEPSADVPTYTVERTQHRFRFLLSDGRTIDVITDHDSSDLRAAVVVHAHGAHIVGVALLPVDLPLPVL